MERSMDLESFNELMVQYIKENLIIITFKELELINDLMESHTLENGIKMKWMEKEYLHGQTVLDMKVIIKII